VRYMIGDGDMVTGCLQPRRSLARRRRADPPGSIPEIEEKTDSIFNCATAYDPQGGTSAPGAIIGISD
jgi:hypothetical protein